MRKLKYIFPVLISVLFICGCYESEVPLSEPSLKVDPRLIKNWTSLPKNKNEKSILLLFRKFNENEYLVAWKEGDDKTLITRGFVTRIDNTNIINVHNIDSLDKKERAYVFFRYAFNEKGNLVSAILSDDYPLLKGKEFKSSKNFNNFVHKNISQNGLFDESIEFKVIENINFEINP
ncbi:hypothetical protein ACFL1N_05185 [Thermodesulfobacteriota bacterium]